MPGELKSLGVLVLLSCGELRSDAGSYASALTETESYESATEHCGRIEKDDLRGDCRVALMENWSRLDPADCETMESALWRDECLFQLGERQWESGEVATGLETCEQTRFRRNCAWHLVQYEVLATLDQSAVEAEEKILGFADSDPMPDAAFQFWLIRFREQAGKGLQLNELNCEGLKQPEPCRAAIQRHVISSMQTQARRHLERICTSAIGERVTLKGEPAWFPGPVALEAEEQWVAEHCPSPEVIDP